MCVPATHEVAAPGHVRQPLPRRHHRRHLADGAVRELEDRSGRVLDFDPVQARGDTSRVVAQQFQSGFWFKQDQTFVNIKSLLADMTLLGVRKRAITRSPTAAMMYDWAYRVRPLTR